MLVRRWPLAIAIGVAIAVGVGACGPATEESSPTTTSTPVAPAPTTSASAAATATDEPATSTSSTLEPASSSTTSEPPTATDAPSAASSSTLAPTAPSTTSEPAADTGDPITIRLRLDRRVDDGATAGFASLVEAILTDDRGWVRAGFRFTFDDNDFDYSIVLAEGPDVDALCLPYDTFGRFSCQIGPVVALNADRWRTAVDSWPASLDEYRTMLVNHEVGHLLGQHHPAARCPGDGQVAPVMAQQSSGVAPCTANPWPLPWEITCARQGVEPLAPPFERDITLTCGPEGPVD